MSRIFSCDIIWPMATVALTMGFWFLKKKNQGVVSYQTRLFCSIRVCDLTQFLKMAEEMVDNDTLDSSGIPLPNPAKDKAQGNGKTPQKAKGKSRGEKQGGVKYPNYSEEVSMVIVEFFITNLGKLSSKSSKRVSAGKKREMWQELTRKVNSMSTVMRNWQRVRKRIYDIKKSIRFKFNKAREEALKTAGGTPESVELTPSEERLSSVMSEASIYGLGGPDTNRNMSDYEVDEEDDREDEEPGPSQTTANTTKETDELQEHDPIDDSLDPEEQYIILQSINTPQQEGEVVAPQQANVEEAEEIVSTTGLFPVAAANVHVFLPLQAEPGTASSLVQAPIMSPAPYVHRSNTFDRCSPATTCSFTHVPNLPPKPTNPFHPSITSASASQVTPVLSDTARPFLNSVTDSVMRDQNRLIDLTEWQCIALEKFTDQMLVIERARVDAMGHREEEHRQQHQAVLLEISTLTKAVNSLATAVVTAVAFLAGPPETSNTTETTSTATTSPSPTTPLMTVPTDSGESSQSDSRNSAISERTRRKGGVPSSKRERK